MTEPRLGGILPIDIEVYFTHIHYQYGISWKIFLKYTGSKF